MRKMVGLIVIAVLLGGFGLADLSQAACAFGTDQVEAPEREARRALKLTY